MEQVLNTILSELKEMRSDIHDLKKGQQLIVSEQTRIVSLISDIPKQFEVLEDSIGLDLERHQRILDLLSTKSIEHEADIKHVKSMIQN